MITNTNILFFYILALWSSFCYGQFRVFRADTRNPDQMRLEGRFRPRGQSSGRVNPDISMINHAEGATSGASLDNDGYVSTSADSLVGEGFLASFFGGTGYVYAIAATPNFIQVAGTLGEFNPFPSETEYAALGGFQWPQVIGWQEYDRLFMVGNFIENPEYNGLVFNSQRPNQGEPSLAGFPSNHRAWGLSPWNAFAPGGGCGALPRKLRTRQATCGPTLSNVAAAEQYMANECPPEIC